MPRRPQRRPSPQVDLTISTDSTRPGSWTLDWERDRHTFRGTVTVSLSSHTLGLAGPRLVPFSFLTEFTLDLSAYSPFVRPPAPVPSQEVDGPLGPVGSVSSSPSGRSVSTARRGTPGVRLLPGYAGRPSARRTPLPMVAPRPLDAALAAIVAECSSSSSSESDPEELVRLSSGGGTSMDPRD